jgi:hypothetical protein
MEQTDQEKAYPAGRWGDQITDWVDDGVRGLVARARKRYLQHLLYRHRTVDVKGPPTPGVPRLALEQIFVELRLIPQPAPQSSTSPDETVPEALRHQGDHVIWDYLETEQLADRNLVIIGPPGSGKTTLLKHIALTSAAGKKHRREASALGQHKLPILLALPNHAETIVTDTGFSLVQAVQASLARRQMQDLSDWFERQLARGRCLIMMDGLNEVANPDALQKMVTWIERQMAAYANNRFIITSRSDNYFNNPLEGVTVLELRPFTNQQVQRFVRNWYVTNEISVQAEDLLQRLRNSQTLAGLAANPLWLTMIATVYRHRNSLPDQRVALYAEFCEVLLARHHQVGSLAPDLTPAQQRVLQPLAYQMMSREQREIMKKDALTVIAEPLTSVSPQESGETFLKMIKQSSGLLLERERGRYSFAHLTFQEYLAAMYVRQQELEQELVAHVAESWWSEAIRLYCAQTDATSIIAACLADERPALPLLTLAIECLEETPQAQSEIRTQLETVLTQGVEDEDSERRRGVTETLLAWRLHRMRRVSEDKYVDDSFITQAEYQLFLDDQRAQAHYYQPDHWFDVEFTSGQGREPVLGVRPSDATAFCDWLTEREPDNWRYRLPLAGEIDEDEGDGTDLTGYWVTVVAENRALTTELAPARTGAASEQWLSRALTRALDLDRDLDLARARAQALSPDLDLAHALGLTRAFDLVRALADDRALARAMVLVRALAVARNRVRDLARDLDRELELDLDLALAQAIALDLDLARLLDFDLARDRDLGLARDLVLARNPGQILDLVRDLKIELPDVAGFLRWYIRLVALVTAAELLLPLLPEQPQIWEARFRAGDEDALAAREELQRMVDNYLDLYVDFVILEERVQGNLPAFEGIRIVREPK